MTRVAEKLETSDPALALVEDASSLGGDLLALRWGTPGQVPEQPGEILSSPEPSGNSAWPRAAWRCAT